MKKKEPNRGRGKKENNPPGSKGLVLGVQLGGPTSGSKKTKKGALRCEETHPVD